jgi:hypothetical protein
MGVGLHLKNSKTNGTSSEVRKNAPNLYFAYEHSRSNNFFAPEVIGMFTATIISFVVSFQLHEQLVLFSTRQMVWFGKRLWFGLARRRLFYLARRRCLIWQTANI